MVGIYEIKNPVNNNSVGYNETAILKTIKALSGRNKPLQDYYVELWENLEGKKFNKEHLECI